MESQYHISEFLHLEQVIQNSYSKYGFRIKIVNTLFPEGWGKSIVNQIICGKQDVDHWVNINVFTKDAKADIYYMPDEKSYKYNIDILRTRDNRYEDEKILIEDLALGVLAEWDCQNQ